MELRNFDRDSIVLFDHSTATAAEAVARRMVEYDGYTRRVIMNEHGGFDVFSVDVTKKLKSGQYILITTFQGSRTGLSFLNS